jgi:hypothetical protein
LYSTEISFSKARPGIEPTNDKANSITLNRSSALSPIAPQGRSLGSLL